MVMTMLIFVIIIMIMIISRSKLQSLCMSWTMVGQVIVNG